MARPHLPLDPLIFIHRPSLSNVLLVTRPRLGRPTLYSVKRVFWNEWCTYTDKRLAEEMKKYLEAGIHKCERTIQNEDESELPASGGEQIAA